jgi:ribose/xylose/arabinose/galactoside ABC-type transport system permease subunit
MWFDEARWHPRPRNRRERVGAGVFLAVFAFAVVDNLANWQLFTGYDRQVAAGIVLIGVILAKLFLPTVTRERRDEES